MINQDFLFPSFLCLRNINLGCFPPLPNNIFCAKLILRNSTERHYMLFYRSDKVEYNLSLAGNFLLTPLSERFVNSTYIKGEWVSKIPLTEFSETLTFSLLWFNFSIHAIKIHFYEFIFFLQRMEYLSKMSPIGCFSTISSLQNIHLKVDKILRYLRF